ncbi:rhodanese-like domain-containing protein [Myxococcota bacterium]|nr:rhodanese-like domain-containing protein [Myxococcota bacterium]
MFQKLKSLPLRVAKRVARAIQDQDARKYATPGADDGASTGPQVKDIPDTELADLPAEAVAYDAATALGERGLVFVDVRDLAAYQAGHIPDAVHMPLGEVVYRLAELPPDARTLVYDDLGEADALRATLFMRARGLEFVHTLTGGLAAWRRVGGKVERRSS